MYYQKSNQVKSGIHNFKTLKHKNIMRLFISPGNSKLGYIPSISLPPCITCPADAPCRQGNLCYAKKLTKLRPAFKKTLDDNLEYYNDSPNNYFEKILHYLMYANIRFFRYHVSGDIPDQEYFDRLKYIARKTQHVKQLIFTKRFEYPTQLFKRLPANLSVVFSMWNNYGDPDIKQSKAWYFDPKDPDPRIPTDALHCSGHCEQCAACWHLRDNGKDIILHKH